MTNYTNGKLKAIIAIMGEERIEALYQIIGSEKLSMATVKNFIKKGKIKEALKNHSPSKKMAKELGVGFSTLYKKRK